MAEWLRAISVFLGRAFRPFGNIVFDTLGALSLLGVQLTLGWRATGAALAALVVVVVLLARAGAELVRETSRRSAPGVRVALQREELTGHMQAGADRLGERLGFWVRVTNEGPPTEFTARVTNVVGAVHAGAVDRVGGALGEHYSVDRVAWSDVADGRIRLARHEMATLRLLEHAVLDRQGLPHPIPVFFFVQARQQEWNPEGHGAGLRFEPVVVTAPVEFDLTITNITADAEATWRMSIGYDDAMRAVFSILAGPAR